MKAPKQLHEFLDSLYRDIYKQRKAINNEIKCLEESVRLNTFSISRSLPEIKMRIRDLQAIRSGFELTSIDENIMRDIGSPFNAISVNLYETNSEYKKGG